MLIYDITTEYLKNPLGIDVPSPRLSWKIKSNFQNVMQLSYRIHAIDAETGQELWDSKVVCSDRTNVILWEGSRLLPRQSVTW